ncbi:MAG: NAD(P)H-dependent oxidoreductase [Candidatus Sericytochromatia bacterium]|nr:NAD(P)H-dependent oxidoreductase [Candidatus Sericytochromatia bacterium]
MADTIRILVMAGSLRVDSLNKKLARVGAEALTRLGATVDLLDFRDVAMPPYDGDDETASGLPPGAIAFKARLAVAQAFLFVSPEYNNSIPGTFKNAIDWASRGDDHVFDGKIAALMAASPGGAGGMRSLLHLRPVLTSLGVWLVPDQVTVSKAHEAFDEAGQFKVPFYQKQVDGLAVSLLDAARRLG